MTEDAQHLPERTGFRSRSLGRIVPQPKLHHAKRAKPGKKARWFGRGADLFQIEWSANAHHPYCFH
ncbi:MAG: hypothetical protein COW84_05820 [Gammaproteobacteria bacterium CG22_combo_CG10-13_8_21_14_all_40_8]|nr:MAG: hypothetical protein COW84_05820 [Gammaproteobacteria bacterium CG22_combo_CG10-13_8_21_14_all_40_8]